MNHLLTRRAAATIIGLAIASAPVLASAQSVSSSTGPTIGDLQSQIQALLAQVANLKQQIGNIITESSSTLPAWMNASSTPPQMPWNNPGMGSSTTPMPPHGDMGCPMIDQDLSLGSNGSEVSSLQQFLSSLPGDLFPSGDVTGYFGVVTQHALGMFQSEMGIASSSTGGVGPITRAFFNNGCPMGSEMVGSSTSMTMHPMMPWAGNASSTSPAHPMRPPMAPMGSSTALWAQGTSSQPFWMKFAAPNNPQGQGTPTQGGPGWHGSVPPWQADQ